MRRQLNITWLAALVLITLAVRHASAQQDSYSNLEEIAPSDQLPLQQFTLTVNSVGSGSVDLNPSGGIYDAGATVILTAATIAGNQFVGWSGDLSGTENPDTVSVDSNITVIAIFSNSNIINETPVNLKIAFIGDQDVNLDAEAVLNLIKEEGADIVLHQGDISYGPPQDWEDQTNAILGPDFPLFASIGNHDDQDYYGPGGYKELLEARMLRLAVPWQGEIGVKSCFKYRGIFVLLTAPDLIGVDHDLYIRDKLAEDNAIWSVSSWHKNMNLMQVYTKSNDTGWGVYEESRKGGAIIATGHAHTYSRTHLLSRIDIPNIASTSDTLMLTKDFPATTADEGKTFVFVSGLAGRNVKHQDRDGEWWASIYTSTQYATFGALFGIFNYNGVPNLAKFYFKNIEGVVIDSFYVKTAVDNKFSFTVNISGSGDVNLSPPGGAYDVGTVVTLAATATAGWEFAGWSGDL